MTPNVNQTRVRTYYNSGERWIRPPIHWREHPETEVPARGRDPLIGQQGGPSQPANVRNDLLAKFLMALLRHARLAARTRALAIATRGSSSHSIDIISRLVGNPYTFPLPQRSRPACVQSKQALSATAREMHGRQQHALFVENSGTGLRDITHGVADGREPKNTRIERNRLRLRGT